MLCSIVGAQIRSLQSDPNADRDCEREKQQQRSRASAAQLAHPTALLEHPLVLLTFWHLATHVSRNLTLEQRASGAPLCRSMVQDHLDCHIDAPLQTPPRWSHHCRRHLGPPIGQHQADTRLILLTVQISSWQASRAQRRRRSIV